MENKSIAEIFNVIADMLSLEDFPTARFEVRAYRKASQTIEVLQEPIEDIYKKGGTKALMELPGIGKTTAGHIEEYLKTGKIKKYEEMKKKYPIDFAKLTAIPGLGAKKALTLYKKLGVRNMDDLRKVLAQHKIRDLEGFGEKSEEVIQTGIAFLETSKGRMQISEALPVADHLISRLVKSGLVEKVILAGSARRMRETVGDLDILVISKKAEEVMDFFTQLSDIESVVAKGPTRTAVRLKMGLNCDLRVLEPKSFGAAMQYFTGSRDHNIQVRTIAVGLGYKLNEYGLFDKKGKNVGGEAEESIYEKLGMQWMPPEMREARGEVKLALEHKIPKLVELGDLKGDMHTHTKDTDGANSLEEMADAAIKANLKYFVTSNHTKSLYIAGGMNDKQFSEFNKKVDKLNEKLEGKITILKGAEIEIMKDGSLDLKKETLENMDCVVGAVHSSFTMSQEDMTKRVAKAIDSGFLNVLAHPTGRVIGVREPYKIDLEKVAETAARNATALEINALARMDLSDTNIMLASKYDVLFAIDSDSHQASHFDVLKYGIGTARRGWLTKDRVLNAMPLDKVMKILNK
jgi:DNA polymerase (family X)